MQAFTRAVAQKLEGGSGLVFVESNIEYPMEAVFDAPVGADNFGKVLGGAIMGARNKVAGFGGRVVSDLPGAAEH